MVFNLEDKQPTYKELSRAFNECRIHLIVYGSKENDKFTKAYGDLLELREKKSTWAGEEENTLRYLIDKLLGENKI